MDELVDEGDFCTIAVDQELGVLIMSWRGYGSSEGFRRANERVLAALAAAGAERILGEIEGLSRISPADQQWLSEDWIPRAVRAGLKRVALVTPAFDLDHAPVLLVGEHVAPSLDLAYFDDVGSAGAWLKTD